MLCSAFRPPSSMSATHLPPLDETLSSAASLSEALSVLFEPSSAITEQLVPQLVEQLQTTPVTSYATLIDAAVDIISHWHDGLKVQFIGGHPRIGEVKNLSHLSAQEQAAKATPPAVLARLAHLNSCYERRYPGLRYITFVNGRTREAIMEEMEDALELPRSLSDNEPALASIAMVEVSGDAWEVELERAVQVVGRIAKSRLAALGVE